LTIIQLVGKPGVMKHIEVRPTIRVTAAMLVTVAVIALSALAMHAPTQIQNPMTLKSIRTDKAATFYAVKHPSCAWFVEAVLPGTNDSNTTAENLKSVAATL
jgi:hypothetical protein